MRGLIDKFKYTLLNLLLDFSSKVLDKAIKLNNWEYCKKIMNFRKKYIIKRILKIFLK
jgi:hypothetical protein